MIPSLPRPLWLRIATVVFVAAFLVFLFLPLATVAAFAFNDAAYPAPPWQGFTLDWYRQLALNAPLKQAALNSLIVALVTTALSIAIGTGGAWLLHRHRFPGSRLIQTLVAVPMVMPEILLGISLLVLFATAGVQLGFATVIIGHVTFSFPFVLVAVQARLRGMDPALEEAALDLGCNRFDAFRLVTLPIIAPAVISGWLLAFTLSLDDLVIASFVSGPSSTTLPIKIWSSVRLGVSPEINALSTMMIGIVTIGVISASLISKRNSVRAQKDAQAAERSA